MLTATICAMCFIQPFRYSTIKSHLKLNTVLNKENYIPPSLSLPISYARAVFVKWFREEPDWREWEVRKPKRVHLNLFSFLCTVLYFSFLLLPK